MAKRNEWKYGVEVFDDYSFQTGGGANYQEYAGIRRFRTLKDARGFISRMAAAHGAEIVGPVSHLRVALSATSAKHTITEARY